MIIAQNIHKSFSGLKVLRGVDLHIRKGRVYGLAGRSGSGKSTFLRCINGLETYERGELIVDGVEVRRIPSGNLRAFRKNIGMIFQHISLLERLTVYDNVALPLRCWKYKSRDIDRKVKELVDLVGLSEKIRQKPRALSGGQKQRVAIARALALEPAILLCDEATSALDPKTSQEIIALLRRINREIGITIVMVTHQMTVLTDACDEVAILEDGRVDSQGSVKHIFLQKPNALKNLIGKDDITPSPSNGTVEIFLAAGLEMAGRTAADLDIELTVVGGKSGRQDGASPGLTLRISHTDYDNVARYLSSAKVNWRIVESPALYKSAAG
jgi:D-methionine transport system ATP-binding protein